MNLEELTRALKAVLLRVNLIKAPVPPAFLASLSNKAVMADAPTLLLWRDLTSLLYPNYASFLG